MKIKRLLNIIDLIFLEEVRLDHIGSEEDSRTPSYNKKLSVGSILRELLKYILFNLFPFGIE